MNFGRKIMLAFTLLLAIPAPATDGYFSTGYGIKQLGQGGAGIAFPQDSLAAATNPAGMVIVGNRFDFGMTLFRPTRGATITGTGFADGPYDASRHKYYFIPELGYNHLVNPNLSFGVSVFGNGGMNTSYTTPIPLLGSTRAGVDVEQLFVAPTVAFKANSHNAFGASLNLGWQRFSASGLQNLTTRSLPVLLEMSPIAVTTPPTAQDSVVAVKEIAVRIRSGAVDFDPEWNGNIVYGDGRVPRALHSLSRR